MQEGVRARRNDMDAHNNATPITVSATADTVAQWLRQAGGPPPREACRAAVMEALRHSADGPAKLVLAKEAFGASVRARCEALRFGPPPTLHAIAELCGSIGVCNQHLLLLPTNDVPAAVPLLLSTDADWKDYQPVCTLQDAACAAYVAVAVTEQESAKPISAVQLPLLQRPYAVVGLLSRVYLLVFVYPGVGCAVRWALPASGSGSDVAADSAAGDAELDF